MSYQSPIEVIISQMKVTSEQTIAGEVVKAVKKVGVNVDKAELLRALAYDRGQYEKGYADGKAERDEPVDLISHDSEEWEFECPVCHTAVYNGQKYCIECGRAVRISEH